MCNWGIRLNEEKNRFLRLRVYLLSLLILGICSISFGQTSGKNLSQHDKDEVAVRQVMNETNVALQKQDANTLDRIYAKDWTYVNASGSILTKKSRLTGLRTGELKYESINVTDLKIRIYDNAAVATFILELKGQFKGEDFSGQYRISTFLVKKNKIWQIVTQQSTTIPAK